MTRKSAARSLIAYLNHLGSSKPCRHGHADCAIRHHGVCINELVAAYPDLSNMKLAALHDVLNGTRK